MSKGETPAMWPKPGIVPGSTSPSVHHSAAISADSGSTVQTASGGYERAHDPICPVKYRDAITADQCWRCDLIARVREDERAAALRDAVEAVKAVNLWRVDRYEAVAAIEALGEKQ